MECYDEIDNNLFLNTRRTVLIKIYCIKGTALHMAEFEFKRKFCHQIYNQIKLNEHLFQLVPFSFYSCICKLTSLFLMLHLILVQVFFIYETFVLPRWISYDIIFENNNFIAVTITEAFVWFWCCSDCGFSWGSFYRCCGFGGDCGICTWCWSACCYCRSKCSRWCSFLYIFKKN